MADVVVTNEKCSNENNKFHCLCGQSVQNLDNQNYETSCGRCKMMQVVKEVILVEIKTLIAKIESIKVVNYNIEESKAY
jgi:hypothetical protein